MTEKKSQRRRVLSFEPDDDVLALVDSALEAGFSLREILNDALRTNGLAVVEAKLQERERQAQQFRERVKALNPKVLSAKEMAVEQARDNLSVSALRSVAKKPK